MVSYLLSNKISGEPKDVDVSENFVLVLDNTNIHVFSLMGIHLSSTKVEGYTENKKIAVLEPFVYLNDVEDWEPIVYKIES